MYDIEKLKTPQECRTVMERARERNLPEIYKSAFRRLCTLVGNEKDDPSDPLVADFYETLAAYEQLLAEKNNRATLASRTRQKIANKGIHQSLIEWTQGKTETNGFKLLVARYAGRFPPDVVELARSRLASHGISIPPPPE
jgi:FPC/CPF motif-containing protein YcgG